MWKRPALVVVSVTAFACVCVFLVQLVTRDQPIEGGIVAYRSHNLDGMRYTHCSCGHKGYYIITDKLLLWYVTDHDSLQPKGEIVSAVGNKITVERRRSYGDEEEVLERIEIVKTEDKLNIVEPPSEYIPDTEYSLKKTYLGADIRERVEGFDYEQWKTSGEDR